MASTMYHVCMARTQRVMVPVSDEGLALIDKMAEAEQRTRAAMFRILIAEAVKARAKR